MQSMFYDAAAASRKTFVSKTRSRSNFSARVQRLGAAIRIIYLIGTMLLMVSANASETTTIQVAPIIRWTANVYNYNWCPQGAATSTTGDCWPGPPNQTFDSAQAAFAWMQGNFQVIPGNTDTLVNFRTLPAGAGYLAPNYPIVITTINGFSPWYADTNVISTTYDIPPPGVILVGTISTQVLPECPLGFSSVVATPALSVDVVSCQLVVQYDDPQPNACPAEPYPVYGENGLKRQIETDYAGPGLLSYERVYRSDSAQFIQPAQVGLIDNTTALTKFSICYPGIYRDPYGNYTNACFPYVGIGLTPGSPSIQIVLPNGNRENFTLNGSSFSSAANINDLLVRNTSGGSVAWFLYTSDNELISYSANGLILAIQNANGNQVSYTYSDINTPPSIAPSAGLLIQKTDSFGRSLQFTYNQDGTLNTLTDPAGGVIRYAYDGPSANCPITSTSGTCHQLTSVTYQDSASKVYFFNESSHLPASTALPSNSSAYLTGIVDERGVRLSNYYYDSQWRVIQSGWGGFDYKLAYGTNQTTITDPNGNQRTNSYLSALNTEYQSAQSQPAGSGCNAATSSSTFDSNGNTISTADFNGNQICYAMNMSRNLETARVEGISSSGACPAGLNSNPSLPSGSRMISTAWHPTWRLKVAQALPGVLITSVYNGQPDPFNGNATASCAPSSAVLADGEPIPVLCKQVQQATTDLNGAAGFGAALQAGVPNRVWQWTYNANGQVLTATDPRNNTTTNAYYAATTGSYANGDLQSTTNPLGQATQFTQYDPHGNLLQSIDPNGAVTSYAYDSRLRLTSSGAGGQTTSFSYDPAGDLARVTMPDGSYVTMAYDVARRMTSVSDGIGNTITYTLDNAGNRITDQVTDPTGALSRQVTRVFDALNRAQQTTGQQ